MEDDFYATIKLKTGEEIFARVVPSEENGNNVLLINNPVVIKSYKSKLGKDGYKIEPWLKTTTDDLFILNLKDVLTMSESKDIEMILLHQQFIEKAENPNMGNTKSNLSRKMGYISSVTDAKILLEKLYNNS
jgi:hypothetical protein